MDLQFASLLFLTFVIHLIGTLAYGVQITGVTTKRIAISLALFNLVVLISRTANAFQAPLLAKRIENNLHLAQTPSLEADFRWLLLVTSLATLVGALLIPTFHRLLAHAVMSFSARRSIPKVILHGFSKAGILHLRESIRLPQPKMLTHLSREQHFPLRLVVLNAFVIAVWTVGVLASLYAGYLQPDYRVTASNLSAIINGVATIIMFASIDPYLSILTDDTLQGKVGIGSMRRAIVWLVGSRLAGTLAAQLLLLPAASFIAVLAQKI